MSSTSTAAKVRTRKSRKQQPSPSHYYVSYREDPPKGRRIVHGPSGLKPKHGKRMAFEPAKHARRFGYIEKDWAPRHDFDRVNLRGIPYEEYQRRCRKMQAPQSLLDCSIAYEIYQDCYDVQEDWYTRQGAFRMAAEFNRKSIEGNGEFLYATWRIVFEIGNPLPAPLCFIEIDDNGLGRFEHDVESPIRVVVPTDEEVALYGDSEFIASKVAEFAKGGAA